MPWIAPVIGAIGSVASGAIGAAGAGADREAARQAYEQSVKDLEAIGVPSVEAQRITMQRYQSAGQWTPELEQSVKLGDSGMLGIATDPNSKAAQMQALSRLQEIGNNGGMMLSDQAAQEKAMGDIQATERGSRQAILQDAQQRGGYGSGMAMAAQLQNQQASANQAHQVGLNTAGMAQQRALEAIMNAGKMGQGMQAQEFSQKAQQQQAQDAINQWNAKNQQDVGNQNTAFKNQAAQYNLNNAQNLSNSNTDIANKEQTYNSGLYQQQFQNQLAKEGAKANARAGQASNLNNQAQNTANMWGGIGSAVAQGGAAAGQMAQQSADRDAYDKRTQAMYGK